MEYIDTAMVGHLGAAASASIGLVTSTTWMFTNLCASVATGFAVQVAHAIGASDQARAQHVLRVGLRCCALVSLVLAAIALVIAPFLPYWLGGGEDICRDASLYFLVFALMVPMYQLMFFFSSLLRCSGNMKTPSLINMVTCALNVAFNYVLIFLFDLGVLGAALGSLCSLTLCAGWMGIYTFRYDKTLSGSIGLRRIVRQSRHIASIAFFRHADNWPIMRSAFQIGMPMALEHIAICSAQIVATIIVAPLGTIAIAANAIGITIEGLCYMPGFGIADAATTLVGQSIGAKRQDLCRSFSWLTVSVGMLFMGLMGALLYFGAPYLLPLMSSDVLVQELCVRVLRIEAFAEPLYAASIVCYGVFVGMADTKIPCTMNLLSIWLVRIPLAAVLADVYGLTGVWIAMATELCFRGAIFLFRLIRKA